LGSSTGPLHRVLVRRPPGNTSAWERYRWREEPDAAALTAEHEALCAVLEQAGAEVVVAEPTTLDAIYVYDPVLVADGGAVLLRPGKAERLSEVAATEDALAQAGVAVVGRLEEPLVAEGGDLFWLDGRTLCAGQGYRTSPDAILTLERMLGVETVAFDLPYHQGPAACLHLLSLLSPLADDLAVAYPPLLPVRLAQLLAEREIEIVAIPDDEFGSLGPNALALAPRVALIPEHNPGTRRRLEAAGVEVLVYRADELSKGEGGPTCLTLPLRRG
jgi:N-dimethylarginine dimethylaminohydrolase